MPKGTSKQGTINLGICFSEIKQQPVIVFMLLGVKTCINPSTGRNWQLLHLELWGGQFLPQYETLSHSLAGLEPTTFHVAV